MKTRPSIQVVHNDETPLDSTYMIAKFCHHWQRAGLTVTCGQAEAIEADLAILHIDQTVVPSNIIPENPAKKPFLNASVLDISKNLFSTLRLFPTDHWNGPVIIKSNLNCFGYREWKKRKKTSVDWARRFISEGAWRIARRLPPGQYPVLASTLDVPDWVWSDPDFIVERFMPEREGAYYCLRAWVFFGDRGYTCKLYSTHPVVKVAGLVKYEIIGDPPGELVRFRNEQGFDFGKFDYVEIDGKPILLDINKTPSLKADDDSPRVKYLADGVYSFLGEKR